MIFDGHVTLGENRDVELGLDRLLETMEELGIDRSLVSPPEGMIPVRNREGNDLVCDAAERSGGRLFAYAAATPWLGVETLDELERARDRGARALKLDPALQGFSLFDGLVDPLVAFAVDSGWPVYIRTGTPPHALPLQVAALAARFPEGAFLLGRSGATDFGQDGPPALLAASNVYADTAHINWPVALAARRPESRVVFTTDAPFSDPAVELARVVEAPLGRETRDRVLGGTLAALLHLSL